jgi:hypothetical protein
MKYTVVWIPAAEAQLASIWINSIDRSAVTAAANAIDDSLRTDPILRGETLMRTIRVLVEEPLQVKYFVYEDDRIVRVLSVQRLPNDPSRN